jgi:hypothetical protein
LLPGDPSVNWRHRAVKSSSPQPSPAARQATDLHATRIEPSSEPEASTNGRRLPVPRGKLLGGSSSINGMVFVRGQAQDFDTWAQMGNRGWSRAIRLSRLFIKVAGQVGIRHNPDFNGASRKSIAIRQHASLRRLTWKCLIGAFAHGLAAGGSVTGWRT